ncbi:MAG: response regulator transcription factor [Cyanobacteria bacterium M_surface_10_m2_179]|nr:response regulator transcription factor [Cyanobacteria bacterium M_surface_10_m2_179]
MKLLVVEDDSTLRHALLRLVAQWGYAAQAAANAGEALDWLERDGFDLVLLDLGLPDRDGLEVCRRVRRSHGQHQPLVLMLTGRDGREDKLAGLEGGADDYVVKPFDPELLQARIRALLRRAHRPLRAQLTWGNLQLHPGDTTAQLGCRSLELTRKEALILEQLTRAQGSACSKEQLLDGFEDGRRVVGDDALRSHMRNLRQKLSAAGGHANLIETVYGLGYRLAAP